MSTMTNPDGEVVTATYDADGVPTADRRRPFGA
jgi:YD repeat-containing protein